MIKVNDIKITEGIEFCLRNSWIDYVVNNLSIKKMAYRFKILSIVLKTNKSCQCVCESIPENKGEKPQIIMVTDTIVRYLLGIEVSNANIGMYFQDYLPMENSYIIITNNKNQEDITPARFVFNAKIVEYDGSKIVSLDMILKNLILDEEGQVNSKCRDAWKFMIYDCDIVKSISQYDDNLAKRAEDISEYMTDLEKMYQDTFIHKTLILYACEKLAKYLDKENYIEDAALIRQRAIEHDNSKILNKTEFRALANIINDKSCLKDANQKLSLYKQDAIELHWKNNSHHPEHFSDINDMSRIDKMEMACDCYARSLQYGTDLINFMEIRQKDRFHFPEIIFDEIIHYCKILL